MTVRRATEDEDLLGRCADGDERAWAEFLRRFSIVTASEVAAHTTMDDRNWIVMDENDPDSIDLEDDEEE